MFKYLWIAIIILFACFMIIYTVYAANDTIKRNSNDEFYDFMQDFVEDHETLCTVWVIILIVTAIVSFITFCISIGGIE